MFVHAVYFWLKPDLSDADLQTFLDGAEALTKIESVTHGFVGKPADTRRPVVDHTYSYALIVSFADKAGHDAYQVHPVHDKFREDCETFWDRVQIYDADSDA